MARVYPRRERVESGFPTGAFFRSSSLHVGAAAAAASLRHDLVDNGPVEGADFDEAYAVARLTPGTNLLAMYTLIGQGLAGWRGALGALTIGSVVPAAIVVMLAAGYLALADASVIAKAMKGARAGALAVFLWAAVRLLRPQLAKHRTRGAIITVAVLAVASVFSIPPFVALLLAGGGGAVLLRTNP